MAIVRDAFRKSSGGGLGLRCSCGPELEAVPDNAFIFVDSSEGCLDRETNLEFFGFAVS